MGLERDDAYVLSAEYALGLMAEDERQRFAHQLLDDRALQADLAFWQERFTALMPEDSVTPPAHIMTNLRAELFGDDQTSLIEDILHPKNRATVVVVGTAKIALIVAVIWLLFGR